MQATQPETSRRCASLYDQSVENAAQAVRDAIASVAAIQDPETRAKAATEVLKLLSESNGVLSKLRQDDIKALRAAGMSYRQIGAALDIHYTRVKQIESGVPMGNSARGRAEKASPPD